MNALEVTRIYKPDDDAIRNLLRLLANDERPVPTGRIAEIREADRGHITTDVRT